MTPAFSSIDSDKVSLGDFADYSISASAIPVDIADTSGAVTTFTTRHAIDHSDAVYAIGQQLTLTDDEAGVYQGKVTSVGQPSEALMVLSADSPMADLAVDKRVYPIYRTRGVPKHLVGAALDHWTQTAGIFYDKVPGEVTTYHSFYGHDYVHSSMPHYRPRLSNPGKNQTFRVDNGRPVYELVPGDTSLLLTSTTMDDDALIPPTDNLPIPSAASGKQLVFSPAFAVAGNQTGSMTWYMATARADQLNAKPVQLQLSWSNTAGFSLYIAHPPSMTRTTLFAPSGALTDGRYRVLIGMQQAATGTTQTAFTLRIINETTGAVTTSSTTVTTPLRGNQVQLNYADMVAGETGQGTCWGVYGYFVSTMTAADLPTTALPVTKNFAPTAADLQLIPGFDGDLWTHIKALLALHRQDFWYRDGQLRTGARETLPRAVPSLGKVAPSVSQRDAAKYIEVVNQNMRAHSTVPRVYFAADSVYQVATGEVQKFTVQTDHSIDAVNDPICVSGITPYPYKEGSGQYVITGSDGYIVSPSWWLANGGRVTARTTGREGEIEITIKGPDFDSPRSPFRVSEGDAGRPALYVTGTGTMAAPETLKMVTGNSKAVADVGETVDSPFVTNLELAYRAASQVALRYASPELKISAVEVKEPGAPSVLSNPGTGALIEHRGNVYRVADLTQNARANSFTSAVQYTTLRHRRDAFPGRTIRQANADNAGRSIKDRAVQPLRRPQ